MTPIPQSILDRGYRALVHVEGWDARFIFNHVRTDPDGLHHLITPRSKRTYTTRNALCYTKRYEPTPRPDNKTRP